MNAATNLASSRRSFLRTGFGALICAPAIVRASSLMALKPVSNIVLVSKADIAIGAHYNDLLNVQEYVDVMLQLLKNQLILQRGIRV